MEDITSFLRCRNCGNYLSQDQAIGRWYCSRECAVSYSNCRNCGRYFKTKRFPASENPEADGAVIQEQGDLFCSPECAECHNVSLQGKKIDF